MMGKRLLLSGLCAAVVCVVASSGDAEARCRCRNGGYRQNNCNNGYNGGTAYYGGQNGYSSGNAVNNTVNPGMNQTTVNTPGIQTNGNYSVNRPGYVEQAPINTGAVPVDTIPENQRLNPVQQNSSPDPDNEGRNASKIPGTAPTKAPAPAAGAQ